jgi:hypothetical protein
MSVFLKPQTRFVIRFSITKETYQPEKACNNSFNAPLNRKDQNEKDKTKAKFEMRIFFLRNSE